VAADYLNLLSQRLGITFKVETGQPWPRILEMLQARELDVLAMAASTPERMTYAEFTRPYIRSPMVIVTNTDADYIAGASELRGKRIAVVKSYASHEWLAANHPELDLQLVDTTVQGLERVATGELFAFVDNLASVSFLIKQQGLSNLKVSGQFPKAFDLAMGVRSDWPLLRGILQKGLDSRSPSRKKTTSTTSGCGSNLKPTSTSARWLPISPRWWWRWPWSCWMHGACGACTRACTWPTSSCSWRKNS
jgi:ABC-type amino acid transport substrate-binding protein